MNAKILSLGLAGLVAVASIAACGDEPSDPQPQQAPSICDSVVCGDAEGVSCDPVDGLCKCGGEGGVICASDQLCRTDPSPTCVAGPCSGVTCAGDEVCDPADGRCKCGFPDDALADACAAGSVCIDGACVDDPCADVTCSRGQSCDPADGTCKCGDAVCGAGERCENGLCAAADLCVGVICADGESCDAADGICKCGGAACSVGQRCEAGSCVSNPCAGVNCGPNQVCSEADGLCHCGAAIGQICAAGQACADDGTGTLECRGSQLCADAATRCRGGTTCDPADGECRCGGVGPSAPICGANQTCDVDARTCLGGNRCAGVSCAEFPGTSCDPEDGICKCGGLGGTPCTAGQVCRTQASTAACFDSCNPVASPTGCAGETACYYDASSNLSLCTEPGTQAIDGTCTESSDCGPGLHCTTSAAEPRCRPYCRVPATGETDTCSGDPICLQIDGAPAGIGLCRTVN